MKWFLIPMLPTVLFPTGCSDANRPADNRANNAGMSSNAPTDRGTGGTGAQANPAATAGDNRATNGTEASGAAGTARNARGNSTNR